jgi:hypothetical protein
MLFYNKYKFLKHNLLIVDLLNEIKDSNFKLKSIEKDNRSLPLNIIFKKI